MNDTTDQSNVPATSTDSQTTSAPMNQTEPVQTPSPEPQSEAGTNAPVAHPNIGAASTPTAAPQMENTEVTPDMTTSVPDTAAVGPTAQPGDVMPMGATTNPNDPNEGSEAA